MMLRLAKIALVFAIALFYALVVFNNLTDYSTNYQFVRHVLMMDSTVPGNHEMWRALNQAAWHRLFYETIIACEAITMLMLGWGGWRMAQAFGRTALEFHRAKRIALAALSLGLLMWLVAFLTIGGEWFLMWESKTWTGEDTAFRMFAVLGIVVLFVAQPDSDAQP
jgi:predicted small integral membrane protein